MEPPYFSLNARIAIVRLFSKPQPTQLHCVSVPKLTRFVLRSLSQERPSRRGVVLVTICQFAHFFGSFSVLVSSGPVQSSGEWQARSAAPVTTTTFTVSSVFGRHGFLGRTGGEGRQAPGRGRSQRRETQAFLGRNRVGEKARQARGKHGERRGGGRDDAEPRARVGRSRRGAQGARGRGLEGH